MVFVFVFGMDKGWKEITTGADINVPKIFKFIISYVTPVFITLIFIGALFKPETSWIAAVSSLFSGNGWPFANDSVIGVIIHKESENYVWFHNGELTKEFIKDLTRLILLCVFLGISFLVYNAWKKKNKKEEVLK